MIEYEESWPFLLLFRWRGSVYLRAASYALPGSLLCLCLVLADHWQPGLRAEAGILELSQGTVWSATTAILLALIAFRTRMGYNRFWEGTGLLHQMKGEWFDTISNLVAFTVTAKESRPKEVRDFRHTIVRLMSLCHASALEEIAGIDTELVTIDTAGLDNRTLRHLKTCVDVHGFNKVEVILHLIQTIITNANHEKLLDVPPPILSRVYQTCSRGYVNLLNTKKIADTRFPFPYVQLLMFLLLLHTILTPMMLSSLVPRPLMGPVLTFMVLFGMFALNFISIELENPFGEDDNDLPLMKFQKEMNSCLLMLLHEQSDIVPRPGRRCVYNFTELVKTLQIQPPASGRLSGGAARGGGGSSGCCGSLCAMVRGKGAGAPAEEPWRRNSTPDSKEVSEDIEAQTASAPTSSGSAARRGSNGSLTSRFACLETAEGEDEDRDDSSPSLRREGSVKRLSAVMGAFASVLTSERDRGPTSAAPSRAAAAAAPAVATSAAEVRSPSAEARSPSRWASGGAEGNLVAELKIAEAVIAEVATDLPRPRTPGMEETLPSLTPQVPLRRGDG